MAVQLSLGVLVPRCVTAALLGCSLIIGAPRPAESPTPPPSGATSVGDAFAADIGSAGVPGGVLARLHGGRVVESRAAGDVGRSSRFLWGSVTKPAAAAVTTRLAAQGRLDLSTPASDLVTGAPAVPVRDLLDHTAGLGFGAGALDQDRPDAKAAGVAAEHPARGHPGSPYAYSSLGYLFVQAVVERATGGPYEQALRARFPGTGIGASAAACADVTRPHSFIGPWAAPVPRRYDGAGAAYGYTCGSVDDLAAVARDHLRDPRIHRPVPTGRPGQSYGDGWRITTEQDGRTTHWHTGTVPGYFSAVHLDPDSGDGVVILLDASGHLHEEQLAALTRASFDRATHRHPAPLPSAMPATVYPALMLAAAIALVLVALRQRTRRRWAILPWAIATGVLTATVGALPALTGYPYRYFWLWEPSLVLTTLALATSLVVGLIRSFTARPAPASPTARVRTTRA